MELKTWNLAHFKAQKNVNTMVLVMYPTNIAPVARWQATRGELPLGVQLTLTHWGTGVGCSATGGRVLVAGCHRAYSFILLPASVPTDVLVLAANNQPNALTLPTPEAQGWPPA